MTTDIMTIQCCPTVREAPFLIKIILHSYNFIMHANIFTIFYANLVTTTDETLYPLKNIGKKNKYLLYQSI